MDFELSADELSWRDEVRDFLSESVTDELVAEMRTNGIEYPGPAIKAFRNQVADRGWWKLTWPVEYGGLGKGHVFEYIMNTELTYAGVPKADLTVTSIAPMIMRYGTQQNKDEFLPPIAAGELTVAVGYSEPNAGTDLASLRTSAVLDGDEWVINGQKLWNSYAHIATHEWLCVRTDTEVPKHRGISVIMVPISSEGIEIRPLPTWAEHGRTNETFFTDVRVPRTNLIGVANKGWAYITGALDLERLLIGTAGDLRRSVDELLAWTRLGGVRRASWVSRRLAQLDAEVEAVMLLGLEAAALFDSGKIPTRAATTAKIAVTELRQRIADTATQMLGAYGYLSMHDPRAPLGGLADDLYRDAPLLRFGGGTNEVLRDVLAQRGHGMPTYGR